MIPTYHITDFPSEQSIGNQFMLENFEKLNRPKNLQWPHKHSFYEIQWLTQGSAANVIDYHQINIEPNTLFFISPGQLHLMSKTEDVKGYTITFTEEFLLMHASNKNALFELSFLDNSYSNPSLKLNTSTILEIEPLLQLLINEVGRTKKSEAIIGHLLYALLNRIQRIVTSEQLKNQDVSSIVKFKQFKRLVEENFKTQNSLSFYSDKLFYRNIALMKFAKKLQVMLQVKLFVRDYYWKLKDFYCIAI